MSECAFCFAVSVDGEPPTHYEIHVPGNPPSSLCLCVTCADQLRKLGVEVSDYE